MATKDQKNWLKYGYSCADVLKGTEYFVQLLLSKCLNMFCWDGLPVTVPSRQLERLLVEKGSVVLLEQGGMIYAPPGAMAYDYDVYGEAWKYTMSNPRLKTEQGANMLDGVIGYNQPIDAIRNCSPSLLWYTITRYANMLANVESTLSNSLVTKRTGRIGIANSEQVKQTVDNVLADIELGNTKTILSEDKIFEGFTPLVFQDGVSLTELSQMRDYIFNAFYNEIGLQTLEEKKERMISDEIAQDTELLNHNLEGMYQMRQELAALANYKWGLDIKVSLNYGRFSTC